MDAIKNHPVYKQILADSCGGLLFNVADGGKYDVSELLPMWEALPESMRDAAGGIVKGVFGFIKDYA